VRVYSIRDSEALKKSYRLLWSSFALLLKGKLQNSKYQSREIAFIAEQLTITKNALLTYNDNYSFVKRFMFKPTYGDVFLNVLRMADDYEQVLKLKIL